MPVILTNRLRWFDSLYYDCVEGAEDDNSNMDSMNNESEFLKRTKAAAAEAAETVVATSRQYGTPIIVWSNGETIEIDPYTERRVQPKSSDDRNSELSSDGNSAT